MRLVKNLAVGFPSSNKSNSPRTTGEKMKTFKAICATLVLALSLSVPAYADTNPGDGHGPGMATSDPSEFGPVSDDSGLTGAASTAADDGGLVTLTDILWVLAAIY
jgi:hypothetical protein